jgi:hypothetical protein
MDFKELLLGQGFSAEQVETTLASMKENKIFTASQENLDVRYEKLKTKHDDLNTQVATANKTIEDLKTSNGDNQTLQSALEKYKTDYEALQKDSEAKVRNITIDTHIKNLMKEHKVKDKYDELLMSKIDKAALQLDDKGSVIGLEDVFTGLKTDYADLFVAEPPRLGGKPPANNGSSTNNTSALEEQIKSIFKK